MDIPRACRRSSAPGVVGPFAASARTLQLMRSQFSSVIWFSRAAGIKMSHGMSQTESGDGKCFGTGEILDRAGVFTKIVQALDVDTFRVVNRGIPFARFR